MSRRLLRLSATATLAVVASTGLNPHIALATTYHQYSIAEDVSAGNYTGVSGYRLDRAVTGQPSDGCGVPFVGSDVFQPVWLVLSNLTITRSFKGTSYSYSEKIDGVQKATISNPSTDKGSFVEAGLESYASGVGVAAFDVTSLGYQIADGFWSGKDAQGFGGQMDGKWLSDTAWCAGQNSAC